MSWNDHLHKAKQDLRASRLDESLRHLDQALLVGGDREYTVYDSRAAVYERQGKLKSALKDVQSVIKLAPAHWQGYARASRLFLRAGKLDEADKMADMALARLDAKDSLRCKKLEEVKADVRRRRSSVNHFGTLPVEIIVSIFDMVVASNWRRVLTLWRVSKRWHGIALNTPHFWSTLILTNRHPARHAQRWIERSKGMIREISLKASLPHFSTKLHGLNWGCLRILKLEQHNIPRELGDLDRLSGLEELRISHWPIAPSFSCDDLLSIRYSSLKKLTLDVSPFSWDILASHHSNLTSLEVRQPRNVPSFEEVMAVLESNPMLEQLILDFRSTEHSPPSSKPTLTLFNLHTLHLAEIPWALHFFSRVALPSLQTLRLSFLRPAGLNPLIEKKLPHLLHLSINCCFISSSDLLNLIGVTPALESLELIRLDDTNSVVEALGSSTSLCPSLTHLDVSRCPDVSTGPIVSLLRSRNAPDNAGGATRAIETLLADGCPQIGPNSIPWIRAQVKTFNCVYMTKKAASWRR